MPLKWRFSGGLMMANIECWLGSIVIVQEVRTIIGKKPYIIVIFQGGPDPQSPPLDQRMN